MDGEDRHQAVDGDEDEDEALSLCDLPLSNGEDSESAVRRSNSQEDFDFCSLEQSVMCAAEEVFFQGQLLPLRSESMDYRSSTSRSSSISSHNSSTSSTDAKYKPLNLFHSHPSPSPKLQINSRRLNTSGYAKTKSSVWNIFRLGLVTAPPKVAFQDLKSRGKNLEKNKTSGSFLGGCYCSVDAVDTVPSKVGVIKRCLSDNSSDLRALRLGVENQNLLPPKSPKKRASHYRTFEWLKQLSLPDEP